MQLDPEILEAIFADNGEDLRTLCERKYVLLVFLRHFGCTFCREALSDLNQLFQEIDASCLELVLVHMAEEEIAQQHFQKYNLEHIRHISDPDLSLYEYFGLHKGRFNQIYGLKVWLRGLKVGWIDGHGRPIVDEKLGVMSQMPGVFLLKNCQIEQKFVHKSAADRPNYYKLAACCTQKKRS